MCEPGALFLSLVFPDPAPSLQDATWLIAQYSADYSLRVSLLGIILHHSATLSKLGFYRGQTSRPSGPQPLSRRRRLDEGFCIWNALLGRLESIVQS